MKIFVYCLLAAIVSNVALFKLFSSKTGSSAEDNYNDLPAFVLSGFVDFCLLLYWIVRMW